MQPLSLCQRPFQLSLFVSSSAFQMSRSLATTSVADKWRFFFFFFFLPQWWSCTELAYLRTSDLYWRTQNSIPARYKHSGACLKRHPLKYRGRPFKFTPLASVAKEKRWTTSSPTVGLFFGFTIGLPLKADYKTVNCWQKVSKWRRSVTGSLADTNARQDTEGVRCRLVRSATGRSITLMPIWLGLFAAKSKTEHLFLRILHLFCHLPADQHRKGCHSSQEMAHQTSRVTIKMATLLICATLLALCQSSAFLFELLKRLLSLNDRIIIIIIPLIKGEDTHRGAAS